MSTMAEKRERERPETGNPIVGRQLIQHVWETYLAKDIGFSRERREYRVKDTSNEKNIAEAWCCWLLWCLVVVISIVIFVPVLVAVSQFCLLRPQTAVTTVIEVFVVHVGTYLCTYVRASMHACMHLHLLACLPAWLAGCLSVCRSVHLYVCSLMLHTQSAGPPLIPKLSSRLIHQSRTDWSSLLMLREFWRLTWRVGRGHEGC